MEVLMLIGIILAVALIVLVLIQPRQSQLFSMDATSNIGKPGLSGRNNRLVKVLTLLISIALFVLLLVFMLVTYQ